MFEQGIRVFSIVFGRQKARELASPTRHDPKCPCTLVDQAAPFMPRLSHQSTKFTCIWPSFIVRIHLLADINLLVLQRIAQSAVFTKSGKKQIWKRWKIRRERGSFLKNFWISKNNPVHFVWMRWRVWAIVRRMKRRLMMYVDYSCLNLYCSALNLSIFLILNFWPSLSLPPSFFLLFLVL